MIGETPASTTALAESVLKKIRAALHGEPRLELDRYPIKVTAEGGVPVLTGEVASVAAKKLALGRAAATGGVTGLIDRVRVKPASAMGDREIRDHLLRALMQEPAFQEFALRVRDRNEIESFRETAPNRRGAIELSVADGVVTLSGELPGLGGKRLAGVLAWWVPGSRDVINGIAIEPPEADNDDEIADAVRLALEKDPFVNAAQIRVGCRDSTVVLAGLVASASERDMAEFDAWYVFGVDRVDNRLEPRP